MIVVDTSYETLFWTGLSNARISTSHESQTMATEAIQAEAWLVGMNGFDRGVVIRRDYQTNINGNVYNMFGSGLRVAA